MAKKTTLNDLGAMLAKQGKEVHDLTETVGFVVKRMATNDQIVAPHTQVSAIKIDIRTMSIADLEDEVFGTHRSKHPKHVPL